MNLIQEVLLNVQTNIDNVLESNPAVKKAVDPNNNSLTNKLILSGKSLRDSQILTLSFLILLAESISHIDLKNN
jgi:hypothetical protein